MPIPAFVSVLRRVRSKMNVLLSLQAAWEISPAYTIWIFSMPNRVYLLRVIFAFPTDGKRAEATPNTEMILVSDVDLDLLSALHTYGSVRNLKDRRNDVYEVKLKK